MISVLCHACCHRNAPAPRHAASHPITLRKDLFIVRDAQGRLHCSGFSGRPCSGVKEGRIFTRRDWCEAKGRGGRRSGRIFFQELAICGGNEDEKDGGGFALNRRMAPVPQFKQ